MKILNEIPVDIKNGQLVAIDIEMFGQTKTRLHRPHGTFACISIAVEGRKEVYQLYDSNDLKKLFQSLKHCTLVGHNMSYDLKQLTPRFVEIQPRFVWDTMLVEQSMFGGYYQHFSLRDLVRRYFRVVISKEIRDDFSERTDMNSEMKRYAAEDAMWTLKIAKEQQEYKDSPAFAAYREVDEKMIWPLLDIVGIPVDAAAWKFAVDGFEMKAQILQSELGFNVNSPQQVIKACASSGIHLQDTKATTLEAYKGKPIIDNILTTRMYRKAVSTYGLKWLDKFVEDDGKVYASWHNIGTETGRMSCVSGNTLLDTNRGVFRIEDYIPQDGDTILTHTGNRKPILRKIYKGREEFIQVECSNGSVVQCTLSHKLQTPNGWVEVRDLHLSSEVISNVNINAIRNQQREYKERPAHVFGGRAQVWLSADSGQHRNEVCQCTVHSEQVRGRGTEEYREKYSDVPRKVRGTKSSLWETSIHVQGHNWGWAWIPTEEAERKVCSGASESHGRSLGSVHPASGVGYSSHRRGQTEQRTRQSSLGDIGRTPETTYENTHITKITSLGTMDVWDIEVADDHSYSAGGLIHHNSSNPNGQNIPQRKLPIYRTFFIASPGHRFIVDDVSQQEPCILAYESKDRILTNAIINGEDLHLTVAREIFGDPKMDKSDPRRAIGKMINLGTSYGLSEHGLSARLNIPLEEAQQFLQKYFSRFTGVFNWISLMRQTAYQNGYVKSALGRRIYLNTYDNQWQNNAINAPIQAGAADFTKMWVRKFWEKCREHDIPYSLCLVVHDEIGMNTPKEAVRDTNRIRKEAFMETAETLYKGIPFKSEWEMGKSWACKSIKEEAIAEEDDE